MHPLSPRACALRLCGAVLLASTALIAQRARPLAPEDFTIEVNLDRTPVLSQGNTGTCW